MVCIGENDRAVLIVSVMVFLGETGVGVSAPSEESTFKVVGNIHSAMGQMDRKGGGRVNSCSFSQSQEILPLSLDVRGPTV